MNAELSKNAKNGFEKKFKLMNNEVFWKTKQNVTKCRDIKLITAEKKNMLINKPAYLGLAILEISKTVMYVFWYGCLITANI